jgi:16S rRNA (guanine966-N2)-methyltransferase
VTRIVAGSARGRRLAVPPGGTRPTSDRVREALFSSLDSLLLAEGLRWSQIGVLDLFAGSGALGLEALSRGAREAVLVERSRAAARVLEANVGVVGLAGATVLVRDVAQLAGLPDPSAAAELVFVDPPYDWPASELRTVLTGLLDRGWIASHAIVIVERGARDPEAPLPDDWPEPRRRAYGDTVLWYGRAASEAGVPAGPADVPAGEEDS